MNTSSKTSICSALLVWCVLCVAGRQAAACTTFSLQYGNTNVYGRNFDWDVGTGAVIINMRKVTKQAFVLPPEQPMSWVSKYGSVTFNQFSREVPVGGINEKGLVVESLVSKAEHPPRDRRKTLNELQWIQYHLDTCSTVDEVLESARSIRISPYAVNLHYFVSDSSGKTAAIDFLGGKPICWSGRELPIKVLANTPYASSAARSPENERFIRCASMVEKFKGRSRPVPNAFAILDSVLQGTFTKWQVVYDIAGSQIHFRTSRKRRITTIDLNNISFDEDGPLSCDVNDVDGGKVGQKEFRRHTEAVNTQLMRTSLKELQEKGLDAAHYRSASAVHSEDDSRLQAGHCAAASK